MEHHQTQGKIRNGCQSLSLLFFPWIFGGIKQKNAEFLEGVCDHLFMA
jgi:hypothetical protein